MNRAFWIVAALGLVLVGYVQLSGSDEPNRGILVTGMTPQIDLIRDIASEANWSIACEGTSGEMISLRVEPGLFADEDKEDLVRENIANLASTASSTETETCSPAPPAGPDTPSTPNPPLAFGDEPTLRPLLELAKSCGFEEAEIAPIAEADIAMAQAEVPENWLALYAGPGSANRYGPGVCMVKMSQRIPR